MDDLISLLFLVSGVRVQVSVRRILLSETRNLEPIILGGNK